MGNIAHLINISLQYTNLLKTMIRQASWLKDAYVSSLKKVLKKMNMWKIYKQKDDGRQVIRKSHFYTQVR